MKLLAESKNRATCCKEGMLNLYYHEEVDYFSGPEKVGWAICLHSMDDGTHVNVSACPFCGRWLYPRGENPDEKDWLFNTLDCGDNSCLFKPPGAGGMRTNGGCRCFSDLTPVRRRYVYKMLHEIKKLRKEKAMNIDTLKKIHEESSRVMGEDFDKVPEEERNAIIKNAMSKIRDILNSSEA